MLHPIFEKVNLYCVKVHPTYEQTCFYLQSLALHQYSPLKVLGSQSAFSRENILVNIRERQVIFVSVSSQVSCVQGK